jgi:hypothetical protein
MYATIAQGPVPGPALAISPQPDDRRANSDKSRARIRPRRQIGSGARSIMVTNPAHVATRRRAKPIEARRRMKPRTILVTVFFAAAASLGALGISAAVDTPRTLMSPVDFSTGKRAIEAETRLALAKCRDVAAVERDICKAQVRGDERIKLAELKARYHGTVVSRDEVRLARAKSLYDVAKAKCSARQGEERMDCLRAARDDRNRSLAAVRVNAT